MFPLLTQNSLSRKRPFVGYRGWCCVFIILRCQDRRRHWTGLRFRSLGTSPRFHLVINQSISHNYPQYEFVMYGFGRLQRILPLISYYFQLNLICLNSRIDVFLTLHKLRIPVAEEFRRSGVDSGSGIKQAIMFVFIQATI